MVWEYRHYPDIYSDCCSNVHRLENGNSLLVFGINDSDPCCRPFTIVEADVSGGIACQVEHISPGKFVQYRIYPGVSVMGETRVSDR